MCLIIRNKYFVGFIAIRIVIRPFLMNLTLRPNYPFRDERIKYYIYTSVENTVIAGERERGMHVTSDRSMV